MWLWVFSTCYHLCYLVHTCQCGPYSSISSLDPLLSLSASNTLAFLDLFHTLLLLHLQTQARCSVLWHLWQHLPLRAEFATYELQTLKFLVLFTDKIFLQDVLSNLQKICPGNEILWLQAWQWPYDSCSILLLRQGWKVETSSIFMWE